MSMRRPAGFISAFYDPLKNPNAPTSVTASAGDASADVSFTAPSNVGGSAISGYGAISTPGAVVATGASSPISVTGLTNGTSYTFQVWAINTYGPSAYSAASGSITPQAQVGLFAALTSNTINKISIVTTGNATNFGNLAGTYMEGFGACASTTRGIFFAGAASGSYSNVIQYVTFADGGTATDFGDMAQQYIGSSGCNSSTRGILVGGRYQTEAGGVFSNAIAYITMASAGNATAFGELNVGRQYAASCSSPTRGIFAGGYQNGARSSIDYITIASTGNATNFGNLIEISGNSAVSWKFSGASNSTRGLFFGTLNDFGTKYNVIQYITIASTGNSTDFGDLTAVSTLNAACASSTRAVCAISEGTNVLNYVTIATTGNASDFGDLTTTTAAITACSNVNGGVQ